LFTNHFGRTNSKFSSDINPCHELTVVMGSVA
jgi:hypothetical protein